MSSISISCWWVSCHAKRVDGPVLRHWHQLRIAFRCDAICTAIFYICVAWISLHRPKIYRLIAGTQQNSFWRARWKTGHMLAPTYLPPTWTWSQFQATNVQVGKQAMATFIWSLIWIPSELQAGELVTRYTMMDLILYRLAFWDSPFRELFISDGNHILHIRC